MKQTTIFDYILKSSKEQRFQSNIPLQRINNTIYQKEGLIKTYIQKSLAELIKEEEEFRKIKDLLGASWYRQENGFGFTDEKNIMIVATIQDFYTSFFNLYKFEDFNYVADLKFKMEDLSEDKNKYLRINGIEYNLYYLFKAFQILGNQIKLFQHKTLKLLFLKNSKFATLICPKF